MTLSGCHVTMPITLTSLTFSFVKEAPNITVTHDFCLMARGIVDDRNMSHIFIDKKTLKLPLQMTFLPWLVSSLVAEIGAITFTILNVTRL